MLTNDQREAIDNLAASVFEDSDDIIAVAGAIEDVIDRRQLFIYERHKRGLSKPADHSRKSEA